jgi:hypothetical protein
MSNLFYAGRATHYIGGLSWTVRGIRTTILPGWAACCSGKRAEIIRLNGNGTTEPRKVTCKLCLRSMSAVYVCPVCGAPLCDEHDTDEDTADGMARRAGA